MSLFFASLDLGLALMEWQPSYTPTETLTDESREGNHRTDPTRENLVYSRIEPQPFALKDAQRLFCGNPHPACYYIPRQFYYIMR